MISKNRTLSFETLSRRTSVVIVLLVLAIFAVPASAQNYVFSVDRVLMEVFVRPDASARIVYDITFTNNDFGQAIDIIDIGTPTADYDITNMRASMDGNPVLDIRVSEFVTPGVEIHLGSNTIRSGKSGVFHFEFTMPDMVFQDVTDGDLASMQITPTWFDDQFVRGTTDLQIAIHMLEGISPDEVLYQDDDRPFSVKALFDNHAVVVFEFNDTYFTEAHIVGVSFPKRGMTRVVPFDLWKLTQNWFVAQEGLRFFTGLILVIVFSVVYLRSTGGTGVTLWVLLTIGLVGLLTVSPGFHLIVFFPMFALMFYVINKTRKQKKQYLPAIAQVEGGGIKRGLTAPEAAALLEMPLNKVLTLIIFGMLKKGILTQTDDNPLRVKVADAFVGENYKNKKERMKNRRKAAQATGVVLHSYEQKFLDAIEDHPKPEYPVHRIDFTRAMKYFLQGVARRVKGFDLSDTKDYYQHIVSRAWNQARSLGEISQRERYLDKNMEWVLMHEAYPTVLSTGRYRYQPVWVRPHLASRGLGSAATTSGKSGGSSTTSPRFTDVAAGFAGWTENTMGKMASAILPGEIRAATGVGKGIVDLSGVDKATGDFFEALASSSGSGGSGGGSSCACACAGCACACACAGGGR